MNPGEGGLAFVAVAIGSIIGCGVSQYWDYRRQSQAEKSLEDPLAPPAKISSEHLRLPVTMIAGPFFIIAYFWLGWTSYPSIPVIVPMLSGLFFGAGSLFLFAGFFNYLTDCYYYAASALAASTITRSTFGAGFPLFTHQMFNRLGVQWACSVLGFISIPIALIPLYTSCHSGADGSWFYKYGHKLRARSPYTFQR